MDVWRYSEADGRKNKSEVWWSDPLIWRWRDWIIRSLNSDKGYDRMILEMLAGDELLDRSTESQIATGFLVRNRFPMERNVWLNNTVEHTAKALLGLTINCARCHDHKFDPITQKEYYEFRHFFEAYDVRTDELLPAWDCAKNNNLSVPAIRGPTTRLSSFVRGPACRPGHVGVDRLRRACRSLGDYCPCPKSSPFQAAPDDGWRLPNGSLIRGIR